MMFHNPYLIIGVKNKLLDLYEKEAAYKYNEPKDRGISRFLDSKSGDTREIYLFFS